MRRIPTAQYNDFIRQLAKDLVNPAHDIRVTSKGTATIGEGTPPRHRRHVPASAAATKKKSRQTKK